jgi:hypothetical protein
VRSYLPVLVDELQLRGDVGLCPMAWVNHGFPHAVQRLVIAREMLKENRAFLLAGVS